MIVSVDSLAARAAGEVPAVGLTADVGTDGNPKERQSPRTLNPKVSMPELTVQINLQALATGLSAHITGGLERAAFLLHATETAEVNPGHLRQDGPSMPVRIQTRSVAEVQAECRERILTDALRDCIEEVSRFLEEVRRVCAAIELSLEQPVSAERWNSVVIDPARKFDRLTFTAKIEELRTRFGRNILHEFIEHIITLNILRNCIVHRHGIVDTKDCNDSNGLVVSWRSLQMYARMPDGTESRVVPPMAVPAGTQILARNADVTRTFPLGERVFLAESELNGLWFTFHAFGFGTAQRVESFAKNRGFTITSPDIPKEVSRSDMCSETCSPTHDCS